MGVRTLNRDQPAAPPALFLANQTVNTYRVTLYYLNGERYSSHYAGGGLVMSTYLGLAPGHPPLRWVVYGVYANPHIPRDQPYGRWFRIYNPTPITSRLEGDRLVCEGYKEWRLEWMPEGFSFPGVNLGAPEGSILNWDQIPATLPAELDPWR
ncbi:MAG: hypothetical protein D6684_09150 [Deinococcus-Thermus bacterium]|jgi:hypothetical protein|nr:MAG: hypothetical protein D6684_09150 [Deinococcota bacterium]